MQLASSSFFGSGCCIDCGRKATARLGKKVLRDVMARGTFRAGPLGRRRGEADPLEPAIGALLAELLDVRVERAPELSKAFVALWGIGLPD